MELPRTSVTPSNAYFCVSMAIKVVRDGIEKGSNYVVSPMSLHIMLSLIAAGTKGSTLQQILSCVGLNKIDDLNNLSSQIISLTRKQHQQLPEFQESKCLVGENSEGKEGKKDSTLEQVLSCLGYKDMADLINASSEFPDWAESTRRMLEEEERKGNPSSPVLSFVNGLWVDRIFGLKPCFEQVAKNVYKAEAREVDFVNKADIVEQEVNSWAERATGGLIKQVLQPGSADSNTALILASALYFKGAWDQRFDPSKAQIKDFHLLNEEIVRVPFMTGKPRERYHYKPFDGYKVLQLPYQSGRCGESRQFAMYFILPDENNGLPSLIEKLNSEPGFFIQKFDLWREEVADLWIPRFKFSFEFEASKTIKEMGLDIIFRPGELTEMVNIDQIGKLYLSKILNKLCIEVNEEGTEAAASSAALMRFLCAINPAPSFVADHPFLFMIREETSKTVIFIGAVLNPILESS